MSEVNLSSAVRSSLSSLQTTADLLTQTQERLATGNRVNSALDDATAFFTASGLNARASDLSTLLDDQGQAIQVVEAADQGITAITDLVESARAVANQALQTDNADERAVFAQQFDDILGQIETLAADASFNGVNLLDSENSQDLTVVFNEDNTASLSVQGVNFTDAASGLGLNRISSSNNAVGTGASTASATEAADTNFTVGSTANFSVGNSNGSTTDFTVQFQGAEGQAEVGSTANAVAGDFTAGDTISIIDGLGTTTALTLQTQDVAAVDGTLNVANGSGAGQIDASTLSVGDTIAITIDNGTDTPQSFSLTLDAGAAANIAGLESFISNNTPPGFNLTAADSVAGGAAGTLDLASPDGNVTFEFTNANQDIGTDTAGTSGAQGTTAIDPTEVGAGGFADFEVGDTLTFGNTDAGTSFTFTFDQATVDAIAGAANADAEATALAAAINASGLVVGGTIGVGTGGTSDNVIFTSTANDEDTTATFTDVSTAVTQTGTSTNFVVAETDGLSADDIAEQINAAGLNVSAAVNSDGTLTFASANGTDGDFQITDGSDLNIQGSGFQAAVTAGSFTDADIATQINAAAEAAGLDVAGGAFAIASSAVGNDTTFTFSSDTGDISVTDGSGTTIASTSAGGANDVAFGAGNGGGSDFS
ncbi:MAG: flagellin hook IN motif-containing protein, partial [Pseudomonadota bacterium]